MVKLFVASFGYRRVIAHTLKHHGVLSRIHDIVTPACVLKPEGTALQDKNELIARCCKEHKIARPLLVDHWRDHIEAARDAGYFAYKAQPYFGLTLRDSERIIREVKEGGVDAVVFEVDHVLCEGHITPQYVGAVLRGGQLFDPPEVNLCEGAAPCLRSLNRLFFPCYLVSHTGHFAQVVNMWKHYFILRKRKNLSQQGSC